MIAPPAEVRGGAAIDQVSAYMQADTSIERRK
jgi:hypothetical protein